MKWISVKDELPEKNKYVLGYGEQSSLHGQNYDQVRLNDDGCWCAVYNYSHLRVTHWAHLTKP